MPATLSEVIETISFLAAPRNMYNIPRRAKKTADSTDFLRIDTGILRTRPNLKF